MCAYVGADVHAHVGMSPRITVDSSQPLLGVVGRRLVETSVVLNHLPPPPTLLVPS